MLNNNYAKKESILHTIKISKILGKKWIDSMVSWSLRNAARQGKMNELIEKCRKIKPDISQQFTADNHGDDENWNLKVRTQHAFQCDMMLKAVENIKSKKGEQICVVDIGDSAGTHMQYLKGLIQNTFTINTISVNLDPVAVQKIKSMGMNAMCCRAEDLDVTEQVDLFVSFEMVEHLHNPAIFFHRLAIQSKCRHMLITVPYLKRSRVGLHSIRLNKKGKVTAEKEHIFELSPEDWKLLLLHSGWKIIYDKTYYQYPLRIPIITQLLRYFWKRTDFEGFWGAILEKDLSRANLYQDWEE